MSETAIISFSELEKMSKVMGNGKMFGKSMEELLPLMLIAQAEGKHPATAAQEYDIIQGRPALKSQATLARFQSSGGRIQWIKRADQICTAILEHPLGGKLEITWTIERAAQAGLTNKDNWKKFPAQMLSARVVAEGVRAIFPACLSGQYTVEEIMDMPDRNINGEATIEATVIQQLAASATPVQASPVAETKPAQPEPEAPPAVDPWIAEWNTHVKAMSKLVSKWPTPDREALELSALAKASQGDPKLMELAEKRAEIYAKYKDTDQIDSVMQAIKDAGRDLQNLIAADVAFEQTLPIF